MVPRKNVRPMDHPICMDGECELVAITRISEEEEIIEGHVNAPKALPASEAEVVLDDSLERPDQTEPVFAFYTIRLTEKRTKVFGKSNPEHGFGGTKLINFG
jgi:hypothetical protein